jgi:hypothetical protein
MRQEELKRPEKGVTLSLRQSLFFEGHGVLDTGDGTDMLGSILPGSHVPSAVSVI